MSDKPASVSSNSLRNGSRLRRFAKGKRHPSALSAADMNCLVDAINALLNPKIVRGDADKVLISDSNWILQLRDAAEAAPAAPGASGFYPFRVYQTANANPALSWRTFAVRSGALFINDATPIVATGTDGINPDSSTTGTGGAFTVNSGVASHKVWIEVDWSGSIWSASVEHGADGWEDFAANDGLHFLVAEIDTYTDAGTETARIRQYVRSDLIFGQMFDVCTDSGTETYYLPAIHRPA